MHSNVNYLSDVRDQYEDYPYPFREPENEKTQMSMTSLDALEVLNHFCFRGRHHFGKEFRALVAGGGTGDAAVFLAEQLRERGGSVVYVDISTASMQVAKERARIRGLKNIKWVHGSLLDVPNMQLGKFDYINCSGVLHHLSNPDAGFRALTEVLKDDGAMGLMLYGMHGRAGIYQVQQLMRLIGSGEAIETRIADTRTILSSLPANHPYRQTEKKWQKDIDDYGDIGVYDLLLHSQDRAYTVDDVYAMVESGGMRLVEFVGGMIGLDSKLGYDPATYLRDPGLVEKIRALPRRRQQAIAELIAGDMHKHTFYVSRREQVLATPDDTELVPFFYFVPLQGVVELLEKNPGQSIDINHPKGVKLQLIPGPYSAALLKQVDGSKSIAEIYTAARDESGDDVSDEALQIEFSKLYELFNQIDWMLLRHKSVPAYTHWQELQNRVSRKYPEAQQT